MAGDGKCETIMKQTTVRKLAKLAGVSPATVSRYLTGNTTVSDEKTARIEEAIKQTGGDMSIARKRASSTIGVLVPNFELDYYVEVLEEIQNQSEQHKYNVVILPDNKHKPADTIANIHKFKLSGIITLADQMPKEIITFLTNTKLPIVFCGGTSTLYNATAVHIDDVKAGYDGTKYLIGQGHKNIALLADYPQSIDSGFKRIAGCKGAIEEAGIKFKEELLLFGDLNYENGYQLTTQLLNNKTQFTAIFAFSDQMAIGAMNALEDNGVKVPRDVSVMGFDDLKIATRVRPKLTTVHQPLKAIVKKVLEAFDDDLGTEEAVTINISHEITVRDSCRRIKT